MQSSIVAKRRGDAVISVSQDISSRAVHVVNCNAAAEKIIGLSQERVIGQSLKAILPPREIELLEAYLEEEDEPDLAVAFRRIMNMHVLHPSGKTIPVSIKVFYGVSEDSNALVYDLLIRDVSILYKLEELRESLREERKVNDIINDSTGLIDEGSFARNVDVIAKGVGAFGLDAVIGVIRVDPIDGGGNSLMHYLFKTAGKVTLNSCREEDIIGHYSGDYIGIVLFDCTEQNSAIVFNRIRMAYEHADLSFDGSKVLSTLSIAFSPLTTKDSSKVLLARCMDEIAKGHDDGGNRIYKA